MSHAAARTEIPTALDAERGEVACRLALRHAGARDVRIAWELNGPADAPLLIVAGGISANRHTLASAAFPETGWWDEQRGFGIDPTRFRVLSIDWVGADGSIDAPIDSADQADAVAAVLDALQLPQAVAWIGSSYGAMSGLQFAQRHPQRLRGLVVISGAHRAHPFASAWRALQRRIAALGLESGDENAGLSLARQLAMLSYRTPEEFAARFTEGTTVDGDVVRVAAEDYLDACGARFIGRMPPVAYRRLSESIDLHHADPAQVKVPTTVVAIAEDRLVPLPDMLDLSAKLPHSELHVLRSHYGHDAFLKETSAIARVLRAAIETST
ncbi:Homoserine acetyltransferase [Lysobacter silvestris]|uniref:Homoserine acetyltransferase n=2 Tax=Solilutibacter silvestris TaxID=1645665 RepID=A0A2K1PXB5_9GAMM|nr:homoserine O-succinyltransferase [Lysobacter silvestris]PNS07430.1 Homoserine acetyltransferase [Lysobacter silvestris]